MPKRESIISILVEKKAAIFVAHMLLASAAGGAASATTQDFQIQQTCFATDAGATFQPPLYSYGISPLPRTRVVDVIWSDVFDCGTGMLSMCQMCYETDFNYPGASGWVLLNEDIDSSSLPTCGITTTINFWTTLPITGSGLMAGTTYQIVWYDTPWDPAYSGCGSNVQSYS